MGTGATIPDDDGGFTFTRRARQAMGQLASSVSVLTYLDDDNAHGTTVSSLTAVSREPLLIGACLRQGSQFARLVACEGQRFAVNVLDSRQAAVAGWFADSGRPPGRDQFDAVDWQPDDYSGAPLIRGSLAWLSCRLVARIGAGDHLVLLAEGVDGVIGEGTPLLSFAGQLHDPTLRCLPRRPARPAPLEVRPVPVPVPVEVEVAVPVSVGAAGTFRP